MCRPGVTASSGSPTPRPTSTAMLMVSTISTPSTLVPVLGTVPSSILTSSPSPLAAGCTDDIVTSDHSPVFGSFEVGVTSQFVSKKGAYAQGDTLLSPAPP